MFDETAMQSNNVTNLTWSASLMHSPLTLTAFGLYIKNNNMCPVYMLRHFTFQIKSQNVVESYYPDQFTVLFCFSRTLMFTLLSYDL
jgi:hypothetical protein